MSTRGSAIPYIHPHTHYPTAEFEMFYGFYSQFSDVRKASMFHVHRYPSIDVTFPISTASRFFADALQVIGTT